MHKLLYILPAFPKLSETFVLNEVAWLQDQNFGVLPLSLCHRADVTDGPMHHRGTELMERTIYAQDYFPTGFVRAMIRVALRSPQRFAQTIVINRDLPNVGTSRLGRLAMAFFCADMAVSHDVGHIHAHWTHPSDVALLVSELTGIPFSLTAHAHDVYETGQALPFKVKKARFIITCTEHNRQYLVGWLGDSYAQKIHRIYHGLPATFFAPLPTRRNSVPTIIAVGRLVRYKGFHRLVEACRVLCDQGYRFRCWIVGQGSQYEPLSHQIAEAGLEGHVELLGPRAQDEVIRLYEQADIFALPADIAEGQYGLPNVLIEAMARGLAVVTSRELPPIGELISDGENGMLVPGGDSNALAMALGQLISNPDLRLRMGYAGVSRTAGFRTENNLPSLFKLFSSFHQLM